MNYEAEYNVYFRGSSENIQPSYMTVRPSGRRPHVSGKFLFAGDEKLWVKGVTYGTFREREDGTQFPPRDCVERDFEQMVSNGINCVRTYLPPPIWFLDAAYSAGLWVMVGLAWEQHVAFLTDAKLSASIMDRVRAGVRDRAGHPSILSYAIGNEIPASIVRWHKRGAVQRFLQGLYNIAKTEDPEGLVTYVNFPTTEYLSLPFLDFQCFNVYLENPERLDAYLARLQNLAGDQPLVMAEIGLDSRRNGLAAQAEALAWQLRTAFLTGCAGTFVFAWTDEWSRGGHDVNDWDFGLTTRGRAPKPALPAVAGAYLDVPFQPARSWPMVSVVVCSHNGGSTIRKTLTCLGELQYPNFEVIVVDDGSSDATAEIASSFDVRMISIENSGLSNARNMGWQHASGAIIAYIDDDAYPDPHWLHYLIQTFESRDVVAVGGPNIAPPGCGEIAECVANAPGGPIHVLLSDWEAEHIPGCNMAIRREALAAIGGFDGRFRTAGDDVDVCWRLQEQGGTIGFHAAAVVWHHRRDSVRAYFKQQLGYGQAEALLEQKWPEKYSSFGHVAWRGRLYGPGINRALAIFGNRIYSGPAGSAPFQALYEPAPGGLASLALMPEWHLLIGLLVLLTGLGFSWPPLFWCAPLLLAALSLTIAQAVSSVAKARFPTAPRSSAKRLRLQTTTLFLHLTWPLIRLFGRIRHGLTFWRKRGARLFFQPLVTRLTHWFEEWQSPMQVLSRLGENLSHRHVIFRYGEDFDHWDLQVRGGSFGSARLYTAVEEHGGGKQLYRFKIVQRPSLVALFCAALFAAIAAGAAYQGGIIAALVNGGIVVALVLGTLRDSASALADTEAAIASLSG